MRKSTPLLLALFFTLKLWAQTFPMDTLLYSGDPYKYINIVMLGDGYTSAEQNTFISNTTSLMNSIFAQIPWSNYKKYINVFAIKVVSQQSGAKHPNTASDCSSTSPQVPVSNSNNYFGSAFDSYGIHRLVVPSNSTAVANVLSANFPAYDQIIVVANSTYYGGSGGPFATATTNSNSSEILIHECGHSFAGLADEYWAGDQYAFEKPNLTQQTNPTLVKWAAWMNYNGVGIYQHSGSGSASSWYKPHNNCKMQYLGSPFCNVCIETTIEKIHALVNPIVNYWPTNLNVNAGNQQLGFKLTELMKPMPNTLRIKWKLDNNVIFSNLDSIQVNAANLSTGTHTLSAAVLDTTYLVRAASHASAHLSTVTWTINKSSNGIELSAVANQFSFGFFPNPALEVLNLLVETEKSCELTVDIYAIDGKKVKSLVQKTGISNNYRNSIDISELPPGTYSIVFVANGISHTALFVKS